MWHSHKPPVFILLLIDFEFSVGKTKPYLDTIFLNRLQKLINVLLSVQKIQSYQLPQYSLKSFFKIILRVF